MRFERTENGIKIVRLNNVTLRNYIERHRMWHKLLSGHPEKEGSLKRKIEEADKAILAIVTSDAYLKNPSLDLTLENI